jgi:hypothetical protein
VLYGHSPNVLYKVDPMTKMVTVLGNLSCGGSVIDLAVDKDGNIMGTTFGSLVKIDKTTLACTVVKSGSYPNSLSFLPQGTLFPDKEALVGYVGSTYVSIDPTTGVISNVGAIAGGYSSSGDIVAVANGDTFLTVKGPSCSDCLVQIDPKTGAMIQNYGSVGYTDVFGLAFWAGVAYGFTNGGVIFSFDLATKMATPLTIPNKPANLQFYGAGSTTCAPRF